MIEENIFTNIELKIFTFSDTLNRLTKSYFVVSLKLTYRFIDILWVFLSNAFTLVNTIVY